jgi:hypothetical protein
MQRRYFITLLACAAAWPLDGAGGKDVGEARGGTYCQTPQGAWRKRRDCIRRWSDLARDRGSSRRRRGTPAFAVVARTQVHKLRGACGWQGQRRARHVTRRSSRRAKGCPGIDHSPPWKWKAKSGVNLWIAAMPMSVVGTNRTSRGGLTMSASGGRPEVAFRGRQGSD